jgi:hypothetical protein
LKENEKERWRICHCDPSLLHSSQVRFTLVLSSSSLFELVQPLFFVDVILENASCECFFGFVLVPSAEGKNLRARKLLRYSVVFFLLSFLVIFSGFGGLTALLQISFYLLCCLCVLIFC